MEITTEEQCVARGTELLDAYYAKNPLPGGMNWRAGIDPEKLWMRNRWLCILGQLFGSYETGLDALGLNRYDMLDVTKHPGYYGFETSGCDHVTWEDLTQAWKAALE